MLDTPTIVFRSFEENDLAQLLGWFRTTHVSPWWTLPSTSEAVTAKYLPRIRGEEDTSMSVILVDNIAVGMIQVGPADPRHAVGSDACAIDLLIGDSRWVGLQRPTVIATAGRL
jgi:Acetyltransferase (GNAT) domain